VDISLVWQACLICIRGSVNIVVSPNVNHFHNLIWPRNQFLLDNICRSFIKILIYFLCPWRKSPYWAIITMLHDNTQITRPLDEWSSLAKAATWQHTTFIRDRHPCPRRESKPQSEQASRRRHRGHWGRLLLAINKFIPGHYVSRLSNLIACSNCL